MPAAGTLGPSTSLHNTRLSAVVALYCPAPDDPADPAIPERANSGHFCGELRYYVLRRCVSTSTMGTSMVDEYPTLFRDSFLFEPLFPAVVDFS